MDKITYDYIIVGGGIAGCSVAYQLRQKSPRSSILLVEKLSDVALGASGAAGAFLSPLLGKPNPFKDLVTRSLNYSVELYKKEFANSIVTCGTTRIPKNTQEQEKFQSYIPFIDFEFYEDEDGYFFPIGSSVKSADICKSMIENVQTHYNYEIKNIHYKEKLWHLNDQLQTKNLIVTTGYEVELLQEPYLQLRAVWGRRIDVETSTSVPYNYHKACSVSKSSKKDEKYIVSIGATHHREKKEVEKKEQNHQELLEKARDIIELEDIKIVKDYCGARASSIDYFPIVGELIESRSTLEEFPYLSNGTYVDPKRFTKYPNLFLLNGVGGRGFVLSAYLAKKLVDFMIDAVPLEESITCDRLFVRAVRKGNF